ncbi:MAG: biotin/lipoyl-binding protein [Planctomycetaceae bacterium]|nr:biotin/lipoyl-binding protein [Planctomycetaceae bacterium]
MQPAPVAEPQAPENAITNFPAPRARILLFALVALAAGIGSAHWLESSRFESFQGYLQARVHSVVSDRDARVARILVSAGDLVAPGQPIVILEDQQLEQRLMARRQEIQDLEIELSRTEAALEVELDIQRRDILDRVFETRWRSAQALRQHTLIPQDPQLSSHLVNRSGNGFPPLMRSIDELSPLLGSPIIAASAQQLAAGPPEELYRGLLAELDLCAEHIAELEKMSRELPGKIKRSMGVDLAEARLAHARAALQALESERGELTIVAEAHGLVGVFLKQVGDHVAPREPIVQLLDEELPYVVLQFPSPRIADFAPGNIVELRFPGGAAGKGRIEDIPPQTTVLADETGRQPETTITAQVEPVGALWPRLPFGSVVEVRRKR